MISVVIIYEYLTLGHFLVILAFDLNRISTVIIKCISINLFFRYLLAQCMYYGKFLYKFEKVMIYHGLEDTSILEKNSVPLDRNIRKMALAIQRI